MTKLYDTVLFDLDGTLTDSAPGILNAIRHALNKVGAPIPNAATLNKFLGPPLTDSFMEFCGFSPEAAQQALMDYREYFSTIGLFENSVYAGVVPLLEELNAAGVKCLVATSKPEPFTRRILDHFDLTRHFAAVYGATMDEKRNRKDQVIAWALEHTEGVGRALMVGDRKNDVQGAPANHIDVVGVLYGYGSEEELRSAGATRLASTPAALSSFILAAK